MMKNIWICWVLSLFVLAACGDVTKKKGGNSRVNNGVTNNNGVVINNGVSNNGSSNNGTITVSNNNQTNIGSNNGIGATNNQTMGANVCPIALAEVSEDSIAWAQVITVDPGTSLRFRSLGSSDPDGSIASMRWSVISRPLNSSERLEDAQSPEPSLTVDSIGEYVVELIVRDDDGLDSCAASMVTINVESSIDVRIELTWDTPADPDQRDTVGTDLDLHYLHPNGTWNQQPFDIFYNNKTADWGNMGADDDPMQVQDDVDGQGPEIVEHDNLEDGATYSVGVFYFADQAFGPSYATLRIYIRGILAYETKDHFLAKTDAFWYAATISWPNEQVIDWNLDSDGFP